MNFGHRNVLSKPKKQDLVLDFLAYERHRNKKGDRSLLF